jgi:hypothetical protein
LDCCVNRTINLSADYADYTDSQGVKIYCGHINQVNA